MKNTLKLITQAVNVALDKVRAEIPRETRELLYEFTEEDFITKTEIEVTKYGYNSSDEQVVYRVDDDLDGTYIISLNDGKTVQFEIENATTHNINYDENYSIVISSYDNIIGVGWLSSFEEGPSIQLVKIEARERENQGEYQPAIKIIDLTDNEADELLEANLEIEGSVFVKNYNTGEVCKTSFFEFYKGYGEANDAKMLLIDAEAYCSLNACLAQMVYDVAKNYDMFNEEYSKGTNQSVLRVDCYEVESIRIYKVTKSSV